MAAISSRPECGKKRLGNNLLSISDAWSNETHNCLRGHSRKYMYTCLLITSSVTEAEILPTNKASIMADNDLVHLVSLGNQNA